LSWRHGNFVQVGSRLWVSHRGCFASFIRCIEFIEPAQGLAQMSVVEAISTQSGKSWGISARLRVGVHLHEQSKQMQREEDLGSPAPVSSKRIGHPECEPDGLVDTLYHYSKPFPAQGTAAVET
jgi:hypothetical protein